MGFCDFFEEHTPGMLQKDCVQRVYLRWIVVPMNNAGSEEVSAELTEVFLSG